MRSVAKRFEEIIWRRLPPGWCYTTRKPPQSRGLCVFETRTIYGPPLIDRRALYVALHEIGHAMLHSGAVMAPHVEEFEAEKAAMFMMRSEGIPVPQIELDGAREAVAEKIIEDKQRGWKIDPAALKFARRAP